jgi:cytochrome c oxidase subunit 2
MMKKWFAGSLLALSFAVLAACGGGDNSSESGGDNATPAKEITIKATNWSFDQQEYHVKKGEPVKLTLVNEQGIHGIDIKDFKVSLNNNKKSVTITPDKTGTFDIVCNIMCGTGHAQMVSKLVVE